VAILVTGPDILTMAEDPIVQIKQRALKRWWIAVLLAFVGAGLSLLSLSVFIFEILNNTIPWYPRQSIREFYVAMGNSFSQGFITGFFLCFFLAMAAASFYRRRHPQPAPVCRSGNDPLS